MNRALSFNDFQLSPGGKFTPHLRVPIPELRQPDDTDDPILLVIAPSAGRVLDLGASTRALKARMAALEGSASGGESTPDETVGQTDFMFELLVECARNPDGSRLCETVEQARSLPMFVFNRFVAAVTGLMSTEAIAAQGKGSPTTSGGASPTN